MKATLALATAMVLISACTRDFDIVEPEPDPIQFGGLVDERLIPYFLNFETEARRRGINVDLTDARIVGRMDQINEGNVIGTCSYNGHQPNLVTIDLNYWNRVGQLGREMVVFHELGHCFLGRGHLESAFLNGVCASLMNSGTSGCQVAYTATNREAYVDELFSGE